MDARDGGHPVVDRGRMLANGHSGKSTKVIDDATFLIKLTRTQYNNYRSNQSESYKLYEYHLADALFNRAEAYFALGRREEATNDFYTVIQQAEMHAKNTHFHSIAAKSS